MHLRPSLAPVFALLMVAACSGTTSSGSSGSPDGSAGADGGCVTPAEGDSCSANDTACPTGGDACCTGAFTCQASTHTWHHEFLGCACQTSFDGGRDGGPLTCGTLTCRAGEYCYVQSGGAVPPDGGSNTSYSCTPLPTACDATPTCACLKSQNVGCRCTDGAAGPRVECDVP